MLIAIYSTGDYDDPWSVPLETSWMLAMEVVAAVVEYFVLMRVGRSIFQANTLRDAFRKLRPAPWLYAAPVPLIVALLGLFLWGILRDSDLAIRIYGITLAVLAIPLTLFFIIAGCLFSCYLLVAAIVVVRRPLAWSGRGLMWIAEHPKGTWSASVFVATTILGVLGFLLKL
jgi:hypothetical protein